MSSPATPDFMSRSSGLVVGLRLTTKALLLDTLCDMTALVRLERLRLRRAAAAWPRRRVLVLAVERADEPTLLASAQAELMQSRHEVSFQSADAGSRGKFENLNALLEHHSPSGYDWLLVLDDDVALPPGFLDSFIFLCERFDLRLAQPAHRHRSHAAWRVTRRRPASLVRETAFVEIGPLCAFRAETFDVLLPFPPLRVGWGLDVHWSAIAIQRGWKLGVVDATPMRHALRPIAAAYAHEAAVEEGSRFLSERPYTPAGEAQRTFATHRSLR